MADRKIKKELSTSLKTAFLSKQPNEYVKVWFKPGCNLESVILETIHPINGRVKDKGKLYEVPVSLIERFEVVDHVS